MKVGIISINAHTKVLNFASPLHSYAFWSFLNEHGIEAKIIDYKPIYYRKYDPKYPLFYYIDHPRKTEEEQREYLKKWKNLFWEREKRFQRFQEFIDNYYVKTKRCYNEKTLDQKKFGFDCYICATDVIWKWNKGYGFDRGFFLACGCMKGKRKIAYAASRGASQYTPEQEAEFKTYLRDFDYISVREKSLKDYCETLTDQRVTQVLDPVFLKSREFYEDLAIEPKEKGYVLIYIVMEKAPSLVTAAVNFATAHNLRVIELSELLEDRTIPEGTRHEIVYGIGVEEWLGYMQHAEYIFTNSFHACCFSVILHKKFWAGKRAGDKVDSVLGLMGLTNRRLGPDCEDGTFADEPINWDEVENRKEMYRRQSEEYILNAIHGIPEEPRGPEEVGQAGEKPADKADKQQTTPDQADKEKQQGTQKTGSIWKKIAGAVRK